MTTPSTDQVSVLRAALIDCARHPRKNQRERIVAKAIAATERAAIQPAGESIAVDPEFKRRFAYMLRNEREDLAAWLDSRAGAPVAAIQPAGPAPWWTHTQQVVRDLATFCFGGPDVDTRISCGSAYVALTNELTAKDGMQITAPVAIQPAGDAVRDANDVLLDRLADILDAKEIMLAHGIKQNDFPSMFAEFAALKSTPAAPVASAPAQPMSLEAERVALPTKESLREAIAEQVSRAEDLMSTFKPHGAKTRYFDAMEATDKIIDQLFEALATQQGDRHE